VEKVVGLDFEDLEGLDTVLPPFETAATTWKGTTATSTVSYRTTNCNYF
jgi:hypothetical protein